jgi:NosR/NirI family nitrous oxide reductase transcriptional regulator
MHRLLRVTLLALAVICLRDAAQRRQAATDALALAPERLRDFFPAAARVEPVAADDPWHRVFEEGGALLGTVAQTAPESNRVIGYSGSTNTLIARSPDGVILGLRILRSGDTPDHLAEVVAARSFFNQFRGRTKEQLEGVTPDAVAGATLTSSAIAEGVMKRLQPGMKTGAAGSLRFPEPVTLEEARALEPEAAELADVDGKPALEVLNDRGERLGLLLRSSPHTDAVVGYKGPTELLLLLTPDGKTLRRVALRKSYDTRRYVGYVTGDRHFSRLFDNRSMAELAELDFKEEKIEGVAGATETSWAVAESLKTRAVVWLEESAPRPPLPGWLLSMRWRWQDSGHSILILSAFLMAFTRLRGIPWMRHAHHLLLVVYGGFWAGEMISQGLLTGWAGGGSPWRSAPGFVLLTAVALLGPVFTGKQLYCHHICPHGAFQQLLARRLPWQWSPGKRTDRLLGRLPFALLALALFSAMLGWRLDVNQLEPFDAYLFRIAAPGVIALAVGGLIWSLFTPLAYCRYGCPTGALFKILRSGAGTKSGWRDAAAAALILTAWAWSHAG